MANIQKYKTPELVILEQKKKLRDYEATELLTRVTNLVIHLLNLLGIKDGNVEQHTALIQFIAETSKHFTFEEINKAFQMYINNEFEIKVFQQLNAVVFGNVMKSYQNYKNQKLKNYRLNLAKSKNQTDINKEKIMSDAVIRVAKEVKETGTITGIAHHIYDYLEDKINASEEQKLKVYNLCKEELLNKIQYRKPLTRVEHNDLKEEINRIKSGGNLVINCAKKKILIDYLKATI